jgi:hypothetical protein
VIYDKENGELRVVTDFFAALQGFAVFRFPRGVQVGSRVEPGKALLIVQVAGQPDAEIKAPRNCRGTINGLGNWGAEMAEPPSKVLLYIHSN